MNLEIGESVTVIITSYSRNLDHHKFGVVAKRTNDDTVTYYNIKELKEVGTDRYVTFFNLNKTVIKSPHHCICSRTRLSL